MGNSDSDSENECFESAEESLDEGEEVKNVATESTKSQKDVAEVVCGNVDPAPEPARDVSGNSMSYRKRPDRVKRSVSNTTTKPVQKLPSTDAIFKTDKIVPDAFFQDITSNLSKNINKSLSTLQQKSSNVKDLILSSLPVSSVNDDEGFSYDETAEIIPLESETQNPEEDHQDESDADLLVRNEEETTKKEQNFGEEKLITEMSCPVIDSSNDKERKPPDIMSNVQKNSSKGDSNLNCNKLLDNSEGERTNFELKTEWDDSLKSRADGDNDEGAVETSSEEKIKDLKISDSAFSNSSCKEMLHEEEEEGTNDSDIKKVESVNPLQQINQLCEASKITSELIQAEIEDTCTENCDYDKISESTEHNQLPLDDSKLSDSDSKEQYTVGSLIENTGTDIKNLHGGEVEVNSECNLEELKTALESIVQDTKANENVKIPKTTPEKQEDQDFISSEEKVEVTQSSNDGWDDFDFSDDEVENITASKPNVKETDFDKVVHGNKAEAAPEKVSANNNILAAKKPNNKASSSSELHVQRKSDLKCKEAPKEPEKVVEPEAVSDDTWDWNDSWDETPVDKEEKVEITTTKPKIEKHADDSSDIGKWTGWDTFAQKPQEKQGNWGLGSWGMDVLLNKATAVTQGISNVLEAGLGAPDPRTLARMEKLEREKLKELESKEHHEYSNENTKNSLPNVNLFPVSGITSLVAGVTSKIVEHSKIQEIGSKVITGGLDTLETFGKKTMEVLQEGDPGLKNKRALLMGNNKPVLSQVLREAREKADKEIKKAEEKEMAKKCHFETLFDDFQGMVHLEALEMLSRQCELKLEQIRSGMNSEEQEDLNGILEEVEQLCALDECELDFKSSVLDFKSVLEMAVEPLRNEISVRRIIQIHENVNNWLQTSSQSECSLILVNQKLVSTLAELAAATVQQFHKSGELLSVKECRKTVEEVDALSRLTNILCTEINRLCEKFISLSRSKNSTDSGDDKSMTEKVNVVMMNSTSYIRQAFDLLIPVIQLGAAV